MGIEVLEPRLQPALTHPGSILLSATEGATTPPVSVATFQDTTPALPLPVGIHDPRFAAPNVCTGSYYSFAYNPPGAAWSFNFSPGRYGSGVAGNGSGFTSGNPDAPEGTQAGFLQGAGSSISQTLDLAAGSYAVRFQAAQRGNWQPAGPQSFQVALDGTVLGTFTPGATRYAGFATDQVGVTAGSHTLTFTGRTGGDSTAFLDQVRLTPAGSGDAGYTATVDWGDGNTSSGTVIYDAGSDTFSVVAGHAYAEEGSYPVTTTVTHGTDTLTVNSTAAVADAPLSAAAAALTADAGGNVSGPVAYFTDANPNSTASDYTATVDWGDGTQTAGTVNVVSPIAGGSFEAPDVGTGTFSAFAYDPTGSAWSFSGSAGLAGDGSGFTSGNPSAPDGTQVAFVQQAGSFSQDVVLPAGTYTLGFRAAQRGNWNQGGQTFQVQVDGTAVGTFTPAGSAYTSFTTDAFTVAAGTHTVRFVGLNPLGGDNTAFIDQVALGQTVYAVTGSHAYAQSGTYTVGVEADDAGGSFATASGTATVAPFPLTLDNPGAQTSGEGDLVYLALSARGDTAGPVSYSVSGLPAGLGLDPATGPISGAVDYAAAETQGGTYLVTASATDGVSTVRQSFTWTVLNVPLALDNPGDQSDAEQDAVDVRLFARGGESAAYTYSARGLPDGLTINPDTGAITDTLGYAAAETNGGVYAVTVTASDGQTSVSQPFTWTVTNVPLAIDTIDDQTNAEADYAFVPLAAAGGEASTYTFTATGLPAGLAVDNDAAAIVGTIADGAAGTYTVTVTASDGSNADSTTFTWTVAPAPLLLVPGDRFNVEGDAVADQIQVEDRAGSGLVYSAAGLPGGLSIDPATGLISGTLSDDAAEVNGGVYAVTVAVVTPDGRADSRQFTWTVADYIAPVPDPVKPTAMPDSYSVAQGGTLNVDAAHGVLANDSNPGGRPLTARLVQGPQHGTVVMNPDGSFSTAEDEEFAGADHFVYALDDGAGDTSEAEADINCQAKGRFAMGSTQGPEVVPGNYSWEYGVYFSPRENDVPKDQVTWKVTDPDGVVAGEVKFVGYYFWKDTGLIQGFRTIVTFKNEKPGTVTLQAEYTTTKGMKKDWISEPLKINVVQVKVELPTAEEIKKAGITGTDKPFAQGGIRNDMKGDFPVPLLGFTSGKPAPPAFVAVPKITLVGAGAKNIVVGFVQHGTIVALKGHYPKAKEWLASSFQGGKPYLDVALDQKGPLYSESNNRVVQDRGADDPMLLDFRDSPKLGVPISYSRASKDVLAANAKQADYVDQIKIQVAFTLDVVATRKSFRAKGDPSAWEKDTPFYKESTVSWSINAEGDVIRGADVMVGDEKQVTLTWKLTDASKKVTIPDEWTTVDPGRREETGGKVLNDIALEAATETNSWQVSDK